MGRYTNFKSGSDLLPFAAAAIIALLIQAPGSCQQPNLPAGEINGVTMTIFPVQRGTDGQQFITTKAGFKITVPGLGIAPDANEIAVYRNVQNKFWYINKAGVTQAVTDAQLQWTKAQINQQQAMRTIQNQENAAALQPPTLAQQFAQQPQTVIVNNNNNQPSSGGSNAAITGLAAATGAMAGAAIGSSMYDGDYHGIPYGAACYTNAGHSYYNTANGAHEISQHTDNPYVNQWNRQQDYDNNSQNRKNDYNNLNGNQQQMLKNEGKEKMDQRQEHPAEDRFHGFRGAGRFRR